MKVILLMAITLDGRIAKDSDHFPDWTEKADKKFFMDESKKAGALIMGSKTYDTIGRPLPGRRNVIMTRNKDRQSDHPDLVFTTDPPTDILKRLEDDGFESVILAGGAQINTLFAKENLIDEIVLTISPRIFGEGISLFNCEFKNTLKLKSVERLGESTLIVKYLVEK